jgi:hypothetical protein
MRGATSSVAQVATSMLAKLQLRVHQFFMRGATSSVAQVGTLQLRVHLNHWNGGYPRESNQFSHWLPEQLKNKSDLVGKNLSGS